MVVWTVLLACSATSLLLCLQLQIASSAAVGLRTADTESNPPREGSAGLGSSSPPLSKELNADDNKAVKEVDHVSATTLDNNPPQETNIDKQDANKSNKDKPVSSDGTADGATIGDFGGNSPKNNLRKEDPNKNLLSEDYLQDVGHSADLNTKVTSETNPRQSTSSNKQHDNAESQDDSKKATNSNTQDSHVSEENPNKLTDTTKRCDSGDQSEVNGNMPQSKNGLSRDCKEESVKQIDKFEHKTSSDIPKIALANQQEDTKDIRPDIANKAMISEKHSAKEIPADIPKSADTTIDKEPADTSKKTALNENKDEKSLNALKEKSEEVADVLGNSAHKDDQTKHFSDVKNEESKDHEDKVLKSINMSIQPVKYIEGKISEKTIEKKEIDTVTPVLTSSITSNAHTITSSDFAQLTKENENQQLGTLNKPSKNDDANAEAHDSKPQPDKTVTSPISSHSENDKDTGVNPGQSEVTNTNQSPIKDKNQNVEGPKPLEANPLSEWIIQPEMTVSEIAVKMSNEIKVYSNEVALAWNNRKRDGVGWTAQASSELKNYMEKIVIAQSIKPECVAADVEKHNKRVEVLANITAYCESSMKRAEWRELQGKTKDMLSKINNVVYEEANQLEKLPNTRDVADQKSLIVTNSKKKLVELDIDRVKDSLLQLKIKSLQTDTSDFEKCIESKTEDRGMIEDTLKDIMRIKNNCVG